MRFNKTLLLIPISLLILVVAFIVYHKFFATSKVAYVRSGELVNSFNGFKQAQKQFESELRIAQGNSDTLSQRLKALKANDDLKKKSIQSWSYQVGVAENELMQYQKNADAQMQARQQELSRDAVDKINLYIQDYGKNNGYKLILGSTDNGSILYGRSDDDITKEILSGLNTKYPLDSLGK